MFLPEKVANILRRWSEASSFKYTVLLSALIFLSYSTFCNHSQNPKQIIELLLSTPQRMSPFTSPSPTNISHIVFGIGASAQTWQRRRSYTELWWQPGVTRGQVWLDRAPHDWAWPSTCPPYRVSANMSKFGKRAPAARIANIVSESYKLGVEDVRWFVMGDDDTVFFTENLVSVLNKYDHEEMYYIGSSSESVEQDVMHSYGMAFGGGGFAVSLPAAKELAQVMDGCLERYDYLYGSDQRVHACLSELGIPRTSEPGFHQVDLQGDMYGMLAAHPIAPLVSLHHLESVKPINPQSSTQLHALKSLMGASQFDAARTLQQTFCYLREPWFNWSISVSWGYTVQLYPWVLFPKDLQVPLQTFKTWRSSRTGPFTFNTREFKLDHPCERPVLFFLDQIKYWNKGRPGIITTVSSYSKYEPKGNKVCDLPSFSDAMKVVNITVIAPKMDFKLWRKAPRRQCCEAQQRKQGKSIQVRIRDCHSE